MTSPDISLTGEWRKSARSGAQSNCVETAPAVTRGGDHRVAVRDSKNPDGVILVLTPAAFAALARGTARFDLG